MEFGQVMLPQPEEGQHAQEARACLGLDVGDRPLARADREVEAETVTLQPPPAGRQRTHPAALAEDGGAHVAAVAKVPDGLRRVLLSSVCSRAASYLPCCSVDLASTSVNMGDGHGTV